MQTLILSFVACCLLWMVAGCENRPAGAGVQDRLLTEIERAEGWSLLFDGESFDGWRGVGRDYVPQGHWRVENGAIHKVAVNDVPSPDRELSGDIMTVETFGDFELTLRWKIAPGANTGLKYNVSEGMSLSTTPRHAALGFEYQMIDDEGFPDPLAPAQVTGALYDLVPPARSDVLKPAGEWNETRIVFRGSTGEHWLNGVNVVAFNLDSGAFAERVSASKFRDIEGFAVHRSGHIVLQDHSDGAWFRDIKIREFDTTP